MQVYKTFFKISLRFFSATIIYLVIYSVLSIAIPKSTNSDGGALDFTASKVDIAVVDNDESEISKSLYAYLDANHNVIEIGTDKETMADELYSKTVNYILVINKGFGDNFVNGEYEGMLVSYEDPASNSAFIVAGQVETYLKTLKGYLAADYELTEALTLTGETIEISAEVEFANKAKQSPSVDSLRLYFTYFPYITICMLINSLGPMLVIWNKPNIKKRTAVSGKSLTSRTFSLMFAAITYSAFIYVICLLFGIMVLRKDFFSATTGYYILNSTAFMFVGVAITYLVSQFCKKTEMLNMWSNIIGIGMSFLCGIFVSRSLLPEGVVKFSKCLPAYYYISVTEELAAYNGTLTATAWQSMLIQLLFALAIFGIAMVVVKAKER